jgi:CheY-like chemotaxis protein
VRDHVVQFYSSDDFLSQEVVRHMRVGFLEGDVSIVVATAAHRRAISRRLGRDAERIVFLDAAEQLASFDRPDGLDPRAFASTIGAAVERAASGGGCVRAFGEMVALLAGEGRHHDALLLESLWNEILERIPVEMLCAYPLGLFAGSEHRDAFRSVCSAHTHVRPAEDAIATSAAASHDGCAVAGLATTSSAPLDGHPGAHAPGVRQVIPRRILVVDDDPKMAAAMARWLRSAGHSVQVVGDGASAIAEVVRARPDIVLLDIAMPKIDGYEVARRLRALPALHACVLVALTGLAEPEDILRAQRAGFDHHLAKPPDLARLEALLRSGL